MLNTIYAYCLINNLCGTLFSGSFAVSDFIACNSVKDCCTVLYSSWFFLSCSENESQALCYRHTDRAREKCIDKNSIHVGIASFYDRKHQNRNKQQNWNLPLLLVKWYQGEIFIIFFSNSNGTMRFLLRCLNQHNTHVVLWFPYMHHGTWAHTQNK